jgi:hypothetical protein
LEELIESHTEELTKEDLEKLINEDDSAEEEEVIARSTLNPKALTKIIKLQQALIDKVMECDPAMERSLKFKREIENASCPYLEIQKELQKTAKQMTITTFFQPKPSVWPALTRLHRPLCRIRVDFTSSLFLILTLLLLLCT